MTSMASVPRPDPRSIPDRPGAYLFRDADGRAVYVGKAISLRKRLASYWGRPLHPRTEAMMDAAASVEWIVANIEVDALMLEYNLIKSHRPRFNVRYRDDKSYPYLAITVGEKWPRARVLRGPKRKGVRYFGPFGHAYAIRETLDALTRVFPVRTCSNAFFDQRARARRPCLYYDIGRCAGPCVPETTGVSEASYREQVEALSAFLAGDQRPVLAGLDAQMREAAAALEFERAAKLRDQLAAGRKASESQEMVLERRDDLDVVGLVEDDLEAAFQVFSVRRGRVMGRRGWVVDKVEDIDAPGLVASFLRELYMDREEVPPRILVPAWPADQAVLEAWLTQVRGSRVRVSVPARGDGRRLLQTANHNATEAFVRHKLKRESDFASSSRALVDPRDQPGAAAGGGLPPRPAGAARRPARVGGAVPAAASPRRGAPVRDHLPPCEARQARPALGPGRHPRGRRQPQEGAHEAVRVGRAPALRLAGTGGSSGRVAIVADARGGVFFGELSKGLQDLKQLSVPYRILFLEASDEDLVRRYEATRRRHPLAPADRVVEGIRKERLMMQSLKGEADLIIDTSGLSPHELRDRIRTAFTRASGTAGLQISIVSFGYKFGVPRAV